MIECINTHFHKELNEFNSIYTARVYNSLFESFGKGFSKEAALASAQGEMCERVMTRNMFEEYYINNLYPDAKIVKDFLTPHLKDIYKIDLLNEEDLFDFNSDIFEILSIAFESINTGKKVYFPINLIQNLYASNGMAFYKDLKTAYYNAKCEIIERYVKYEVIKYLLPLPKISHPLNSKNIQIYDATLDGRYPVMAASYIEGDEIILSFGCDLNREVAIKKAYLELLQTGFKKRGKFNDDEEYVKSSLNLIEHFIDLSGDVHPNFLKKPYFKKGRWDFRNLNLFKEDEFIKAYKNKYGVAIHLIIPSISEIYPIDDLIYYNINRGKFIRDKVLKQKDFEEVKEHCLKNGVWNIGEYIGVIFDKPYTINNLEDLYEKGYSFSTKYILIKEFVKRLNCEIYPM